MTNEEAINILRGQESAYWDTFSGTEHIAFDLAVDALKRLKEQEPVEPILKREGWNKYYNDYACPVCDQELVYEQNYCSECGRSVKWDGFDRKTLV